MPVKVATLLGFVARIITDIRQYPTYPTGRIIHLLCGFITAFIGIYCCIGLLLSTWGMHH